MSFTPSKPTEFWCSVCDQHKVNSEDESTGVFHVQFGHQFNQETKQYDGDYVGVMYAICDKCITN